MATGIIYGTQSGIIRRVVVTDEPQTLKDHLEDGESMLQAPDSVFAVGQGLPDPDIITAYLTAATGIIPEPNRCVVIDDATGEVANVVAADPTIDAIAGYTLFQDATGVVGSVPDETGAFRPLSGDAA